MRMRLIPLVMLSGLAFVAAHTSSAATGGKWLVIDGKKTEILKISGLQASTSGLRGADKVDARNPGAQWHPIDMTIAEKDQAPKALKTSGGKLAKVHILIGGMDYELTNVIVGAVRPSAPQEDLQLSYEHLTVSRTGNMTGRRKMTP